MKTENCVVNFRAERSGDTVAPKKDLAEEEDRNQELLPGMSRDPDLKDSVHSLYRDYY
jgi:hypothetical protein